MHGSHQNSCHASMSAIRLPDWGVEGFGTWNSKPGSTRRGSGPVPARERLDRGAWEPTACESGWPWLLIGSRGAPGKGMSYGNTSDSPPDRLVLIVPANRMPTARQRQAPPVRAGEVDGDYILNLTRN